MEVVTSIIPTPENESYHGGNFEVDFRSGLYPYVFEVDEDKDVLTQAQVQEIIRETNDNRVTLGGKKGSITIATYKPEGGNGFAATDPASYFDVWQKLGENGLGSYLVVDRSPTVHMTEWRPSVFQAIDNRGVVEYLPMKLKDSYTYTTPDKYHIENWIDEESERAKARRKNRQY